MTRNNIDMPSSFNGEIQLATMIVVVVGVVAMVVATITTMATTIALAAKTKNNYFTFAICSLCKFHHVFVQITFDFSYNVNNWGKKCHAKVYWGGNLMLKMLASRVVE
jgi:hypothetical protein